jgi:hypothetical protein
MLTADAEFEDDRWYESFVDIDSRTRGVGWRRVRLRTGEGLES